MCDKCEYSTKQGHKIENIEKGFEITRTVPGLHELYARLRKRDDGTIICGSGERK